MSFQGAARIDPYRPHWNKRNNGDIDICPISKTNPRRKEGRSGVCRRERFPNQESTTYGYLIICRLLILGSRKSISDSLSGCPKCSI